MDKIENPIIQKHSPDSLFYFFNTRTNYCYTVTNNRNIIKGREDSYDCH